MMSNLLYEYRSAISPKAFVLHFQLQDIDLQIVVYDLSVEIDINEYKSTIKYDVFYSQLRYSWLICASKFVSSAQFMFAFIQ